MKPQFSLYDKSKNKFYFKGFHVSADGDLAFDPKIFKREEYDPFAMEILILSSHNDATAITIKEGDILEMTQFDKQYIVEVYWDDNNCALRIRTKDGTKGFLPVENPKIIGNMMQTPEKFV